MSSHHQAPDHVNPKDEIIGQIVQLIIPSPKPVIPGLPVIDVVRPGLQQASNATVKNGALPKPVIPGLPLIDVVRPGLQQASNATVKNGTLVEDVEERKDDDVNTPLPSTVVVRPGLAQASNETPKDKTNTRIYVLIVAYGCDELHEKNYMLSRRRKLQTVLSRFPADLKMPTSKFCYYSNGTRLDPTPTTTFNDLINEKLLNTNDEGEFVINAYLLHTVVVVSPDRRERAPYTMFANQHFEKFMVRTHKDFNLPVEFKLYYQHAQTDVDGSTTVDILSKSNRLQEESNGEILIHSFWDTQVHFVSLEKQKFVQYRILPDERFEQVMNLVPEDFEDCGIPTDSRFYYKHGDTEVHQDTTLYELAENESLKVQADDSSVLPGEIIIFIEVGNKGSHSQVELDTTNNGGRPRGSEPNPPNNGGQSAHSRSEAVPVSPPSPVPRAKQTAGKWGEARYSLRSPGRPPVIAKLDNPSSTSSIKKKTRPNAAAKDKCKGKAKPKTKAITNMSSVNGDQQGKDSKAQSDWASESKEAEGELEGKKSKSSRRSGNQKRKVKRPKSRRQQLDIGVKAQLDSAAVAIGKAQLMCTPAVFADSSSAAKVGKGKAKEQLSWGRTIVGTFVYTQQGPNPNGGGSPDWLATPRFHVTTGSKKNAEFMKKAMAKNDFEFHAWNKDFEMKEAVFHHHSNPEPKESKRKRRRTDSGGESESE
jgi:hypothetical protein